MIKKLSTIYEIMDKLALFSEKLGAEVGRCPVPEGICALYIYSKDENKFLYVDKNYSSDIPQIEIRYVERITFGSWKAEQRIMILKEGKINEAKAIIKTFIKENYEN
jgi:hypothetical protein